MRYAALLVVLIAGCGPADQPASAPDTGSGPDLASSGLIERTPDTCGLTEFEGLVGQQAEAVNSIPTTRPVRIVAPGSIVTTEYNPQRVNVDVDGNNTIVGLRCG